MHKNILIGIALLSLTASLALSQEVDREYGDRVVFLDDDGVQQPAKRVKVQSATYEDNGVVYLLRGGRIKNEKNGSRVLLILYGDAPRVYSEGEQNLMRGQYAAAASDFDGAKNAVDAGKCREWLLEYAAVRRGQALTALGRTEKGNLPDAVKEFKAALTANPKSLLYDEIQLGLVEAYTLQKKWDDAKAAATNLQNVGKIVKQPIWQAKGQKAVADILLSRKSYADAVSAFGDLASLAGREGKYEKSEARKATLATLETSANVEQGWALVAWAETSGSDSDWTKARSHFEALASKFPGNEMVAAAVLNGVGRTLMKSDPRAAYLKFVEAQVTYFNARSEVARAFYLKALALKAMGGATNKQRAEEALKELRKFFPDSPFARK